jgi:Tol biopolymer transport system component
VGKSFLLHFSFVDGENHGKEGKRKVITHGFERRFPAGKPIGVDRKSPGHKPLANRIGRRAATHTTSACALKLEYSPQFSPDGSKIVFASDRSGSPEIWVSDSAGRNLRQLTENTGSGSPRWSPDGRQIVYDSLIDGNAEICVINADGGPPRRLTTDPAEDIVPSWSHDGQWIYFCSNRTGSQQIWKLPAAGGQAVQFTLRLPSSSSIR